MNKVVEIWAVFDRPDEHPENYVARRFLNNTPTEDFIVLPKLKGVEQALVDRGLVQVKFDSENPKISQLWIRRGGLN